MKTIYKQQYKYLALKKRILFLSSLFFVLNCVEKFPIINDFGNQQYKLVNQSNEQVVFPRFVNEKLVVINYIFTNCPDICPLSTNNMRLIQERVSKEKIKNLQFVSLSFDPLFDTPDVLKKFAEDHNLNLNNWTFLTGDKSVTDAIIKQAGVLAVPNDSTVFKDGKKIFYYVHTDRIQLMDTEGKIRKNYKGSTINIDEIISDIKNIE
jgi:protein SCO1